jgi:hypothetical protein
MVQVCIIIKPLSISNCSFTNNTFNRSGYGIGIYNEHSQITVFNTSFLGNSGPADGGAIANVNGSSAIIGNCIFKNNIVGSPYSNLGRGSGIYNDASGIDLYQSTFVSNYSNAGGVILLASSNAATVSNVSFVQNRNLSDEYYTETGGGGITNVSSSPVISNCLFVNDSAIRGGAIFNSAGSLPVVSNCTFYKNYAENSIPTGGAVYCGDSSGGTYTNCIFWENTATFFVQTDSGAVYTPIANEFYSANDGSNPLKPQPEILYSIIKSPFPVLNVLDSGNNSRDYPQFVDTTNLAGDDSQYGTNDDGLRLQPCSPGIDAGLNSAIPAGITKDIKDDARVMNNSVDLGCYENESPVVNVTGTIASNGDSIIKSVYGTLNLMKDCRLIAGVEPTGTFPVMGGIQARVMVDTSGSLFTTPYVRRYYDIIPSENPEISTAAITLYFTQADFDAYNQARANYPSLPTDDEDAANNRSNIVIHQFHGANGQGAEEVIIPSAVVWSSTHSWWEVTFEVTGFSRFYLNTSLTALPIVLEYFKGWQHGADIYLRWKLDCSNFSLLKLNLQKSSDGNTFITLYQNTISEQQCQLAFNYTDINPVAGKNYYRLQLIEPSGKTVYSNTLLFDNTYATSIIVRPQIITKGQLLYITVPKKNYGISV